MRDSKADLSLRVALSLQKRDHAFASSLCHLSLDKTRSKMTPELCVLNTSIFMSKRRMTGVSAMEMAVRRVTQSVDIPVLDFRRQRGRREEALASSEDPVTP